MTDVSNNQPDHQGHSACGCAGHTAAKVETSTCCGDHGDHAGHAHHHPHEKGAKVLDPVCGMSVDPLTSKHRCQHNRETFHFCSAGCRAKFAADPAK